MAVENVKIVYDFDSGDIEKVLGLFSKLTAEEKEQLATLNKIQSKTKQTVASQQNEFGKLPKTLNNIKNVILGTFAIDRIVAFGKQIINTTATFQKFEAQLETALGSRSKAQKALANIVEFAAKTPFQVEELTNSFVSLANRGIEVTNEQLGRIGDVASALGKPLEKVTEAILDVSNTERWTELGIKVATNGNKITGTFKGVTIEAERTEAGALKLVEGFGKLQGVAGGMEKQSKTLGGQLSNLQDSISQLFFAIGSNLSPAISNVVSGFTSLVNSVKDYISSSTPLTDSLRLEKEDLNSLVSVIRDANTTNEVRKVLIDELNQKYPEFTKQIDISKASDKQLQDVLKETNKAYDERIFILAKQELTTKLQKQQTALLLQEVEITKELNKVRENKRSLLSGSNDEIIIANLEAQLNRIREQRKTINKEYSETIKELQKGIVNAGSSELAANNRKVAEEAAENAKKDYAALYAELDKFNREQAEKNKKLNEEESRAYRSLLEQRLNNAISANKFILDNDKLTFEQRIKLIEKEKSLRLQLVLVEKQNQLATAETSSQRTAIIENALFRSKQIELETAKIIKDEYFKLNEGIKPIQKSITSNIQSELDKRLKATENAVNKELQIQQDKYNEEVEAYRRKEQLKQEIINTSSTLLTEIGNAAFAIQGNNRDAELQDIQAKKEYELRLAGENAEKRKFIEAKYAEEERKIKTRQARADKDKALFDVFIATATKIIQAFPNYALMALAGVIGGLQGAAIASKPIPKFRKGIENLKKSFGLQGTDKDGIIIEAHEKERIVPAHINQLLGNIKNEDLPKMVELGKIFGNASKGGTYVPSKQDFKEAVKEGLREIPLNSINIDEEGFSYWTITKNKKERKLNANNTW